MLLSNLFIPRPAVLGVLTGLEVQYRLCRQSRTLYIRNPRKWRSLSDIMGEEVN
jgi:hypothetical protein